MRHIGGDGYLQLASSTRGAVREIRAPWTRRWPRSSPRWPDELTAEQFAALRPRPEWGVTRGLPARLANINGLLAEAAAPLGERLLEFLGALYTV